MNTELLSLRLVHIFGGIFWVGTALFTTFFLVPALTTMGPDAGKVMGALQKRGMMTWLPLSGLGTATEEERADLMHQLATLRKRGAVGSIVVVLLLVLAASTMAVARYLT